MTTLGRLVRTTFFPPGTVARIWRGPLRGSRYRVTEESGWAPILGRWEPEAQLAYTKLLRPGDVVWDLGANTGIHTLLFARLAGPSGSVLAFEPLRANVEQIRETCAMNGIANVTVVEKAVSDSCEPAVFHIGLHDKQGSLVGIGCEDGRTIEVSCTTMDVASAEFGPPDFVKIDIEGAESSALAGFQQASRSFPTFAIDLHTPSEDVAVGKWLEGNGYHALRLLDAMARSNGAQGREFERIRDLTCGWGTPHGIWGTVIAVHPSRREILERLS